MKSIKEVERIKYEKVWSDRAYAVRADGDPVVDLAFDLMGCKPGETLIDWGCGSGKPAAKFQAKGLSVLGFDIAHNCMDADVKVPLLVRCLWDLPDDNVTAQYAFSTDVLEHIPPSELGAVLYNISARTTKAAFIQVCLVLDISGPRMNPPERLHLSILTVDQWRDRLSSLWAKVEDVKIGGKARYAFVCYK